MLNGICGFASILLASKAGQSDAGYDYMALAGYMILLAMLADALDGSLARMSHTTSSFGGQLDSLCDMISFGAAPAFLMLRIVHQGLAIQGLGHQSLYERLVLLAGLTYLCCTAIRLARFNVEHMGERSDHSGFVGLPSPAAAGVVVSLVIFYVEIAQAKALLCGLPVATAASGILMVSRVPYPHVLNQYIVGKKPFSHLIKILALLAILVAAKPQTTLLVAFCGFAAAFPIKALYLKLLHKPIAASQTNNLQAESASDLPQVFS